MDGEEDDFFSQFGLSVKAKPLAAELKARELERQALTRQVAALAVPFERPYQNDCPLLDLPPELLISILEYVSFFDLMFGVGPTCLQLHDLANDGSLWRRVDYSRDALYLTDDAFRRLTERTKNFLVELNLTYCQNILREGFHSLCLNCPGLRVLDLSWCVQVDDSWLCLIAALTRLERLSLDVCSSVTDRGIRHLSALVALTALDLNELWELTFGGVSSLLIFLPNLTSLSLKGVEKVTVENIATLQANWPTIKISHSHFGRGLRAEEGGGGGGGSGVGGGLAGDGRGGYGGGGGEGGGGDADGGGGSGGEGGGENGGQGCGVAEGEWEEYKREEGIGGNDDGL